jgi:hypothetical protein
LKQLLAPVRDRLPLPAAGTLLLPGAPDAEQISTALGSLVGLEWLPSRLRQVHAVPGEAVRVAQRSYWHANGFAKLLLHVEPQFCIRLHVWLPGWGRRGETNPHAHRWDFASTVLCGDGLAISEHAECAAGAGQEYLRHSYDGMHLIPDAPVHLRTVHTHTVNRHERYTTGTEIIHTVDPRGTSLVATLLVQGPRRHATTPVYRLPGDPPDSPKRPIDAHEVRNLVDEVLADLERQGDG